jgi:hypothetical protein
LTLEEVWKVLGKGRWESKRTLSWASGLDGPTLDRIINFLDRWDFVETRNTSDLQVRRKPCTTSPVEVIKVLRRVVASQSRLRRQLAERVACQACGGRNFRNVGDNRVECDRCHEEQWYSIELYEDMRELKATQPEEHPPA